MLKHPQMHESMVDEAKNFDVFIKAMVQVVEKYGRFVLQEALMMGEHIFERLARERNITVEEMWAIIFARIEKG